MWNCFTAFYLRFYMATKRTFFRTACSFALIAATTILFSSCASAYYNRQQDQASKFRPCDCTDLHLNHAEWHFIDQFGQKIDATGKCTKGMKNGTFDFYSNGILIARTKFSRDTEVKTKCYVKGMQTYNLYYCMSANANAQGLNNVNTAPNQTPAQAPAPVKKSVWD